MGSATRFGSTSRHHRWLLTLVLAAFCSWALAATAAVAGPSQKTPLDDYDETVRKGDSLYAEGNYRDAVLAYERAGRIAYNNGKIDTTPLEQRLAQARKARDEGAEGEVVLFLDLAVPQATSVRAFTSSNYRPRGGGVAEFDGTTEEDRWLVTNPYLPGDRRFFSMIYGAACSLDGALYVAANAVVPAEASRRRPRSNLDWYADNGHGLWLVAPDGRVTTFAVGAYGTYPAPGLRAKPRGFCNVGVADAAPFGPSRWGGIAIAPNGDAYVSDKAYHMILKLRRDGIVEHVAGGGENACAYKEGKSKREFGYRDGPGKQALFKEPRGLAIDRESNLLVADPGNCALRRIDPSGNVTTVQKGCYADLRDQQDRTKRINHIHVAVDPQGRPVVGGSLSVPSVDIYSNVHRLDADGRIEQLLSARKGYANSGELRVEYLSGLAFLPDGRLLIADDPNNLLRTVDGKRLTDWLGALRETRETDVDGRSPKARVRRPGALCVAGDGSVFITPAAPKSGPVRKVDSKTREVSTWVY